MCLPCYKQIINEALRIDFKRCDGWMANLEGVVERFEAERLPGVSEQQLAAWLDEAVKADEELRTAAAAHADAYDKLLHRIARKLRKAG